MCKKDHVFSLHCNTNFVSVATHGVVAHIASINYDLVNLMGKTKAIQDAIKNAF